MRGRVTIQRGPSSPHVRPPPPPPAASATKAKPAEKRSLLVREENLKAADKVRHGHRLVRLPVLKRLHIVNKDDKVVVLALVVDLVLGGFSASHIA